MSATVQLPSNPLYRNNFLRTLSHMSGLGSDSGECFHALHEAGSITSESWRKSWSKLAHQLDEHAAQLLAANQKVSARNAYLRAANYHRTAFGPIFGFPLDKDAVIPSYDAMSASFAKAAQLFDPPFVPLEIPYKDVKLPGYLATPAPEASNGRLMVVIGGYDGPMEEMYFFLTHHALSRGYSVVVFDGPGQGQALLKHDLKLAHAYGEVLESVLDTVGKLGTWKQTAVTGLSLGGLLCLKAVANLNIQSRIDALIADPGELNLIDAFRARIPFPKSICDTLPEGPAWAVTILSIILNRMVAGQGMAGWALRRGMLVHGCKTPIDYVKTLHEFDNEPVLAQIKIPVLTTRAEDDEIAAQAEIVHGNLVNSTKKSFMNFTKETGAEEHCEVGARHFYSEKTYAWLDSVLS